MTFVARDISREITHLAASYPVVTVLGPRQSGKTTLVRKLFFQKPYISLEDPDVRSFAESDPRGFLGNYSEGAVFDEIQRAPFLLSYLQTIVDNSDQKGLFILTGSHQHELHQSISQSLAGRTAVVRLLPFCLSELPEKFQNKEIEFYLFHGMYPRVYNDSLQPTTFYNSYMQTYVERDVRQLINIKDLGLFQRFMKLCASRIGQIFNANSMSNELGISSHTVGQWVSILEASFVVFRLPPYFENFGKRSIKSPKLYFTDVGLASYCLDITRQEQLARDPLRGNLIENFVIAEIVKHRFNQGINSAVYFYRDSNQNEVDVIVKEGNTLCPIEIKASKTFNPFFLKGLNHFKSMVADRCQQGYLIYTGEHEQKIDWINVINYQHARLFF
jgi:uncharacterized protein